MARVLVGFFLKVFAWIALRIAEKIVAPDCRWPGEIYCAGCERDILHDDEASCVDAGRPCFGAEMVVIEVVETEAAVVVVDVVESAQIGVVVAAVVETRAEVEVVETVAPEPLAVKLEACPPEPQQLNMPPSSA